MLQQQDPESSFEVEVDTSEAGVGAVLIQWDEVTGRPHPVAYFSRNLSQNYDIGNRELLAIKLALEEWRHLNLEYLQTAKRLIHRQARWAMFFIRFDLTREKKCKSRHPVPTIWPSHGRGQDNPNPGSDLLCSSNHLVPGPIYLKR